MHWLMIPGAPWYALAAGAGLMALSMLLLLERHTYVPGAITPTPARIGHRLAVGQLIALPITLALLTLLVTGVDGFARTLTLVGAVGSYLAIGLVIPRRPLVRQQQERRILRQLTPGFIDFLRVSLSSFEGPQQIMERYTTRSTSRIAPMQHVVGEALLVMERYRQRPFEALLTVARTRNCRELTDVTDVLAQAEREGGDIQRVLEAQQQTLEFMLQDEFKRMLNRRQLIVVGLSALALVFGIIINLLYVITAGGAIFVGM